eukprot:6213183-Pleurochrysis_carterae.AAC.1
MCRHCSQAAFSSLQEFEADRDRLRELRAKANDGEATAKKEYDNEMSQHAASHLDQLKYRPPALEAATDIYIVDPLHCLELNVAKTGWKYSFGDKMDESSREKATAYMESIGCYFDMRAKGQRNPESKFMTGATVDDYVMGPLRDVKSKSPGLSANTVAMCEIVYGAKASSAAPAAVPAEAAAARPSASSAPNRSTGSRRRRAAPIAGFEAGMPAASDSSMPAAHPATELLDLTLLDGADEDSASPEMKDYLNSRFGNFAENVLAVLRFWEAYGKVFSAWREVWIEDTQEYRAQRALRFLRAGNKLISPLLCCFAQITASFLCERLAIFALICACWCCCMAVAMECSDTLNKISNYKHQS